MGGIGSRPKQPQVVSDNIVAESRVPKKAHNKHWHNRSAKMR